MESNFDGEFVVTIETITLTNNDFCCAHICRSSNYKLVDVDGLVSSLYYLVTGNISISKNTGGDDIRLCHVANSDAGSSDVSLFGDITNSFRLESNRSIEEDANLFQVR